MGCMGCMGCMGFPDNAKLAGRRTDGTTDGTTTDTMSIEKRGTLNALLTHRTNPDTQV